MEGESMPEWGPRMVVMERIRDWKGFGLGEEGLEVADWGVVGETS